MNDLKRHGKNHGRVTVLVEERPENRAAVRMHVRQVTGEQVLETIGLARERLEQLLKDAGKLQKIRQRVLEYQPTAPSATQEDKDDFIKETIDILEAP